MKLFSDRGNRNETGNCGNQCSIPFRTYDCELPQGHEGPHHSGSLSWPNHGNVTTYAHDAGSSKPKK